MPRLPLLLVLPLLTLLGCRSTPQADRGEQWWANMLLEFSTWI